MLVLNASLYGVELKPTQEQITQAVQEGKKAVGSKFMPINTFGEMGYCGWGFLQTKLWNIWAGSQFAERKFKPYTNEEIQKNLAADGMLVTYTLCTDNPRKPEVHIVLRQSQNVIQPVSIKSSHP